MELLYNGLKEFMQKYQLGMDREEIAIEIINYSIKLLYEYFLRCFVDEKRLEALALLSYDIDIDDKV